MMNPSTSSPPSMTASIVITTKNRKDELRTTLASCVKQDIPLEILVIDDGSTDGTDQMVRTEFPSIRLERREESKGLIVRRNEGARMATGDIVISLDDDAEFSDSATARTVLAEFCDPVIAAVAIPFVDVNRGPEVKQREPSHDQLWIANEYIGTAHGVRREIFNELGGYREFFLHQGEEGDFCIRLLSRGYFVRLGGSNPILHHESKNRSLERMNVYGQRNLMLFALYNVPWPAFPMHLLATMVYGLRWGCQHGTLFFRLRGTFLGFRDMITSMRQRHPVRWPVYRMYRRLKKAGHLPLTFLVSK